MIPLMTDAPKPDSATLLARAERAIEDRQLPTGVASRVWGGRGSGLPCSLCGQPIDSNDVEIELDGVAAPAGVRFHSRCHLLWQQACKRMSDEKDH
jgi:hypothetical protein